MQNVCNTKYTDIINALMGNEQKYKVYIFCGTVRDKNHRRNKNELNDIIAG